MTTSKALYCGKEEYDHGQRPFLLRARRADLLLSRTYAMTTSTALYSGKEEDEHLEDDGVGHGHLGPAFLVKEDLGLTLSFLGLECQTSSSPEDMP